MLEDKHRDMLIDAYRRFKETKDFDEVLEAISLVRLLAPEKFFQVGGKTPDPSLEKRVFFNEPYSSHWSGTCIKKYGEK